MSPTILLLVQGLVVLIGPILFGWWLHRRLSARWHSWMWGAAAFVGSQVVRIPLLIGLTALLPQLGFEPAPEVAFWFNLVVLTLTAGLFEETARHIVLSRFARRTRQWRDGIMFGAGHGGIEAMLLIGLTVFGNLLLLSTGDLVVEQVRATSPEQAAQVIEQLETLRNLSWVEVALSVWERVLAITFHIAASLLVLHGVRRGEKRWWALAVLFHVLFNAVALLGLRYLGIVGAEAMLTLFTLLSLFIIFRARQWPALQATTAAEELELR